MWFGSVSQQQDKKPEPKSFRAVYNNNPENTSPFGYYEFLPEGYNNVGSTKDFPLIISLAGGDEFGNGNAVDLPKVLKWGIPKQCNSGLFNEPFIVLSIQCTEDQAYNGGVTVRDFITYSKGKYRIDESRVYLTGMSAGGMIILYYLQKNPSTHGIAAAIPISSPGEEGYTNEAEIAASNCPQWWMSNIGDPTTPWQNDSGGYTSVLNQISAISAINPNVVEKLTGFNNNTHTGTWDGIYDSSLVGQGNPTYDIFDEPIYDWLLSHTKG